MGIIYVEGGVGAILAVDLIVTGVIITLGERMMNQLCLKWDRLADPDDTMKIMDTR